MPIKGHFPTPVQYLGLIPKDWVKVMTVNYNRHRELGEGARF